MEELATPGQELGKASELKAGKGAYVSTENGTTYASLTGFLSLIRPPSDSVDQVLLLPRIFTVLHSLMSSKFSLVTHDLKLETIFFCLLDLFYNPGVWVGLRAF